MDAHPMALVSETVARTHLLAVLSEARVADLRVGALITAQQEGAMLGLLEARVSNHFKNHADPY